MITRNSTLVASLKNALVSALGMLCVGAVWADDLAGEDQFLCAASEVIVCVDDGTCASAVPWELNIPQFINVDLKKRSLTTTEASGDLRMTKVDNMKRDEDRIYLQGIEGGRAYTFVIDVETGFLTVVVARDFLTVSVFGACTPSA